MTEKIKPKWYSGKDILNRGIKNFELLAAVKKGDLTPYDKKLGQKVVDYDDLPKRRKTIEEIIEEIKNRPKLISDAPPPISTVGNPIRETIVVTKPHKLTDDEIVTEAKRRYEDEKPETSDWPQDCVIDLFTLESVINYIYKADEVDAFKNELNKGLVFKEHKSEEINDSVLKKVIPSKDESKQNNEVKNYFRRTGDFWQIGYEGAESKPIKHVDGLLYIGHLLKAKPGTSISCQYLVQVVSGKTQETIISESMAKKQDLSIGFKKQSIGTDKERKIAREKYQELQERLSNASIDEEEEIQEQLVALEPYLNMKKRNFTDSNDKKAQANIKKRLEKAYEVISEANMKELVKHLRNNIKPDDAYGRIYTGTLSWEINIE